MCHIDHEKARVRLALRIADVLAERGIDPDTAETFAAGGRHIIAQLAKPGIPARKVDVPSDTTWAVALEIARHRVARADAAALDAMGIGR